MTNKYILLYYYIMNPTDNVITSNKLVSDYKGYTVYFILHAMTLITAFTWHQLIQDYIGTFKKFNALKMSVVFTLLITFISVFLHVFLTKYSKQPEDM